MPDYGIDISHYQDPGVWAAAARDGVTWGFIKAAQGTARKDPAYDAHRRAAHNVGIITGCYHFYEYDNGADAARWWRKCSGAYGVGDLKPSTDVEGSYALNKNIFTAYVNETEQQFQCPMAGYIAMSYLNNYPWLRDLFVDPRPLWIPAYRATDPHYPQEDVWQYTDKRPVPGYPGVDGDITSELWLLLYPSSSSPPPTQEEVRMNLGKLNKPVVRHLFAPDGDGGWFFCADGGVFPHDGAPGYGSHGGEPLNAPIVDAVASIGGYTLIAADGGTFPYGPNPPPIPSLQSLL